MVFSPQCRAKDRVRVELETVDARTHRPPRDQVPGAWNDHSRGGHDARGTRDGTERDRQGLRSATRNWPQALGHRWLQEALSLAVINATNARQTPQSSFEGSWRRFRSARVRPGRGTGCRSRPLGRIGGRHTRCRTPAPRPEPGRRTPRRGAAIERFIRFRIRDRHRIRSLLSTWHRYPDRHELSVSGSSLSLPLPYDWRAAADSGQEKCVDGQVTGYRHSVPRGRTDQPRPLRARFPGLSRRHCGRIAIFSCPDPAAARQS
jgi:hypothetical protein